MLKVKVPLSCVVCPFRGWMDSSGSFVMSMVPACKLGESFRLKSANEHHAPEECPRQKHDVLIVKG